MRGEYRVFMQTKLRIAELPPRARRIHGVQHAYRAKVGTTSACAENTYDRRICGFDYWNYLRVRGEYTRVLDSDPGTGELPPRARRILHPESMPHDRLGTTSACAENTLIEAQAHVAEGNYLRVRGEYNNQTADVLNQAELPPRARRIPLLTNTPCPSCGTTSACAENTIDAEIMPATSGNYLRVRGEYKVLMLTNIGE